MSASYESLPVPPPSPRASSQPSPAPPASSAFSITGLKRLFGGSSSSARSDSRKERKVDREAIPEEVVARPSVAKQHLAHVAASLTGNGSSRSETSGPDPHDYSSYGDEYVSGFETPTEGGRSRGPGGSGAGPSGATERDTVRRAFPGGSEGSAPSRSPSRSRSRSRAPSGNHAVLPDGTRFVRPLRLSGASPSVRVSLQNAETSAILSSSVGASSGRPSSEFRFPDSGEQSPTFSEDLPPRGSEPRPRRLSFTTIPSISAFAGRGGRPVDDDARSIWSIGTSATPAAPKANLSAYDMMKRIRNEGLSTRYWIKDESAKDCFQCGSTFTTFRRRHHCRICGQIFCVYCASTILPHFGNLEKVRVCDGCRPAAERHESLRLSRTPTWEDDRASVSRYRSPSISNDLPLTPSSSRFYRRSGARPRHSRLSTSNSLPGIYDEDIPSAPESDYAQSPIDEESRTGVLTEKNSRGLSRQASDEDAGVGTTPTMPESAPDSPCAADGLQSPALSTATAPFRRSLGDEDHPESSNASSGEAKARSSEEPSPAESPVLQGLGLSLEQDAAETPPTSTPDVPADEAEVARRGVPFLPAQGLRGPRHDFGQFDRSDSRLSGRLIDTLPSTPYDMSMVDPDVYHLDAFRAAEAAEVPLSKASTEHIQRSIRQALARERVPLADAWAVKLESLLSDVADRLAMLDEVEVGKFAINDHVRVKRIPGGRPRDSEFVSGVVITKNVMHKSMPRHLSNPRIMLLSFPLEYQRHDGQFLSLDKVVSQEHEYLRNLVVRIQDSFPHIILAQRNVSQVALDFLLERGIVVARHVKPSAVASISHAFGAEIISSMNALLDPRLGRCRQFRVQTFVHPQIPGGRKTFLRFEGESQSSCTIVLRGATMEDLAKVKRIINTLVLIVYNAKLEGYLLHDEHVEAHVPPALPSSPSTLDVGSPMKPEAKGGPSEDSAVEAAEDPDLSRSFEPYDNAELTGSALVHYPPPYALQRIADDSRRVRELRDLRDAEEAQRVLPEERRPPSPSESADASLEADRRSLSSASADGSVSSTSDASVESSAAAPAPPSTNEKRLDRPEDLARQALVDEAEAEQAQHLADWRTYSRATNEKFDLRDHQRLFVLESLILYRVDGEPSRLCRAPELRTIEFYRENDVTIGQYLRSADEALTSDEPCPSPSCNEPLHRHIRIFVHDRVVLRIAWHAWNNDVLQGAIGLSSTCRRGGCRCASRLVRASTETARLSLAKFFDLSFHPSGAFECLDESCGHDGQADHVRFWHYGDVRVSISMDFIDLRDVVAPPRQVKVRPDRQVELRNAEFEQVEQRTQAFFDSVQARIAGFKQDCIPPERVEECQEVLDSLAQRCEADRHAIEALLRTTYEQAHHSNGTGMIDVRRALQERSHAFDADWNAFVKHWVPSDMPDFRRASIQLKRMFPEAPASVPPTSRSVSATLPPAIEVDEPFDGTEPPPPSPHTIEPETAMSDAQTASAPDQSPKAQTGGLAPVPELRDLAIDPDAPAVVPVLRPPLSRSSSVRTRRASTSSEPDSDSTVCADGEMTATLTWARNGRRAESQPAASTGGELAARPPRRRIAPQIAEISKAYNLACPKVDTQTGGRRPLVRRSATDRPSDESKSRPRPAHAFSEMDSSYAHMVGVPHLARQPLAAAAARPSRIPYRKSTQNLPLARMFDVEPDSRSASPNRANGRRQISPVSTRSSSPARRGRRPDSPESSRKLKPPSGSVAGAARPAMHRMTSSRSTIKAKTQRALNAGSESSDARPSGSTRGPRAIPVSRAGSGRGMPRRAVPGRTVETLRRRFEAEQSQPERRGIRKQARPLIASQPTHQVFDNINDAIAVDSDDEDAIDEASSVGESGGADDEFDTDNEGPELDDETQKPPNSTSGTLSVPPIVLEPASSEATARTGTSPSDHTDGSPQQSAAESDGATNASSDGPAQPDLSAQVAASPALTELSTFPRMSEGESSGTERRSIFNTFTSLWNYRNGDFVPLTYPTLATEHLYLDNPILLRDDEPTTIIAHALSSKKYYQAFQNAGLPRINAGLVHGGIGKEDPADPVDAEATSKTAEELLRGSSQRSFKLGDVELGDISARCTVFWAEQFEALRQKCGCATQFIESLARCFRWDAAGGKSKVDFMKTLDDRFIVKQLSRPEMEVFARFAPAYFEYMADALFNSKPTVLAKVFGIYRISLGKHYRNVDFLVMENLFYGRELKQIFDLKGSTRNRRAEENNPVLLDENLIERKSLSLKNPIYVREESKQLVKEAVWNDSQFLSDLNVMDYSLVIGVDALKAELVVGIVDYIRTYTWDKRLESWVKETAFLGGTYRTGGPTVITPKQYKTRFREAIDGYLLLSPTPWLDLAQLNRQPDANMKPKSALTNDDASITDLAPASAQADSHPAPAPPPSDSASIFEAALGTF